MPTIRYEQAVYGSFPFWDRGYAVLGRSPGCADDWIKAFVASCQRFGEPPRDVASVGGVYTVWLGGGALGVVGASLAGADDHGRPRAMAFHGLFLDRANLSRLGDQPLLAAGALRRDWTSADSAIGPGSIDIPRRRFRPWWGPKAAEPARLVANLLRHGRKIAYATAAPDDGLVRAVWPLLGDRARRSRTFATWAFSNDNRFDLLAAPRLHALDLGPETIVLPGDPMTDPESLGLLGSHIGESRGSWLSPRAGWGRKVDSSAPIADSPRA